MSEFDNLQRLIRLKRYETPGEDFVDDFLASFHQRQRAELLRQSARGLLWERLTTFWDDLVSPRWTAAALTACVAILAAWGTVKVTGSGSAGTFQDMLASAESSVPASLASLPPIAVESELIREVEEGRQLEIESILLSRHFESDEVLSADDLSEVVSVSSAALPVSVELAPLSGLVR